MKSTPAPHYILTCTAGGHLYYLHASRDRMCRLQPSTLFAGAFPGARTWTTLAGIQRFIEKEKAAGSTWHYGIVTIGQ